jgi:hypothetical protein
MAKTAITVAADKVGTCRDDALVHLDSITAKWERSPSRQLREITRMMVADARRALSGEAGWPQAQVERLVSQIVSGQFGECVPRIVK